MSSWRRKSRPGTPGGSCVCGPCGNRCGGTQVITASNAAVRRSVAAGIPQWDDDARQLKWRGVIIKKFRHDAANQRAVLQAFQDQVWPSRITDLLRVVAGFRRKNRLRETVKSLNRSLHGTGIRFRMDGTTRGVFWELDA